MVAVRCIPSSNGDLTSCVEEVPEPATLQALLAQPTVEALHMRILRRLAWLYVSQSIFHSSAQDRKCRLVSSGPLSQRIACGLPR